MSRVFEKTANISKLDNPILKSGNSSIVSLAIIASAMLFLPGCSYFSAGHFRGGEHITVGSIPDDYRTTHPVTLSEQEQHLDVLIGTADTQISVPQRSVIQGFVDQYKSNGSGAVQIMLPSNGANAAAARRVLGDMIAALKRGGVPAGQIITTTYTTDGQNAASPVRISYRAITASTNQCGKWPDDIGDTTENKHYADYGCSYQNNVAAMLANPADLLGPRAASQIDATKRGNVIKDYESAISSTAGGVAY